MKSEYLQIIQIILGFLLSGGFLAGIYAILKIRPEAGQITVVAAQGAVVVQTGVIDSLREEMARLRTEVTELRQELEVERAENKGLRVRIRNLEGNLTTNPFPEKGN